MRAHLIILVALAILALALSASAVPTGFTEANDLYTQGKFAEAKARYEQIAATGAVSANLFYNLGNAEFRLNAKGPAALAYERALLLQPNFPEAAANLTLVRNQTGAKLVPDHMLDRLILPWSPDAYAILAAVAFWIAVFSVAAFILYRWSESLLLWTALVLAVMAAGYAGLALSRDSARRSLAVILEAEAPARLEALDRSDIAETLTAGSRVRILSEHGPWIYCELPGDRRGWLPSTSLGKLQPPHGA